METFDVKDFLDVRETENEITRPKPVRIITKDGRKIFQSFLEQSITNAEWLPEYDDICDWLKDNQNKGLMLFGMNGRGKTMIATKILPLFFDYYFFHKIWQEERHRYLQTFNQELESYKSGEMKGDSRDIWEAENMDESGNITADRFLRGTQRSCIENLVRKNARHERYEQNEYLRLYRPYLQEKVYTLEKFLYYSKPANGLDYCGVMVAEYESDKWPTKIVVFDDVGTEPEEFVVFGNRHRLFAEAVDYCEKNGVLLIFTTNLTLQEITARYGERVADRLRQLVQPVVFTGKSMRK